MAQICLHCGTENPDENGFCSSCGAPLAGPATTPAPAAQPPAPFAAAPAPPAPAFPAGASPYLGPPPGVTPPQYRTSRNAVLAIAVSAVVVIGGAGVAFAALHKGGTTPTPAPNAPVSVPTAAPTGVPTQPPVTTPPSQTPSPAQGKTLTTPFASVFVPTGYTVSDQHPDYILLTPPNGEEEGVGVQSESVPAGTTDAGLDQALLEGDQENGDPSAAFCSGKAPSHSLINGSGGPITADVISICESLTPASGPAIEAVDGYIDGVARAADGSLKAVWFEILAPASSYQSFANSIPSSLFTRTVFTDSGPVS